MEMLNLTKSTKLLYDSQLTFFTTKTLHDILAMKSESVFFNYIWKLQKNGVLTKIERNKYILTANPPDTLMLANMLYQPSYISFETALNYYGILPQFPRETTSATTKKTKQKTIMENTYSYTHLDPRLYFGYEKRNDYIIATPEKALFDQAYLTSKGIKRLSIDEYDLSHIDKKIFYSYLGKAKANQQFQDTLNKIRSFVHI